MNTTKQTDQYLADSCGKINAPKTIGEDNAPRGELAPYGTKLIDGKLVQNSSDSREGFEHRRKLPAVTGEGNAPRDWQEAKVSDKPSQILAARFYNGSNELIQSYQLVQHGRAFAIADFRNGRLERFDCLQSKLEESKRWLATLQIHNLS